MVTNKCYIDVSDKPIYITPARPLGLHKGAMVRAAELVDYKKLITLLMTNNTDLDNKDWKNLSMDQQMDWYRESQRNWRSWGSWFSWGSPVGLGIWFVLMAAALWIVVKAFH